MLRFPSTATLAAIVQRLKGASSYECNHQQLVPSCDDLYAQRQTQDGKLIGVLRTMTVSLVNHGAFLGRSRQSWRGRATRPMIRVMEPKLNNQVFLALATIAWANGELAPEERAGILSAARNAGYSEEALAYLSTLIETRVELSSLSLHRISAVDRVFVYAAAEWVARVDGKVDQSEADALRALGDFLKVSEEVRAKARRIVLEIANHPGGDRPERYDLVKLREALEASMKADRG